MFFGTANISAEILSVIEMGWQRVNSRAGYRPFHTLSYRLEGGAAFYSGEQELLQTQEDDIVFVPAEYDFSKQAGKGRILAVHFSSSAPLPAKILRFSSKNPSFFRSEFQKLHRVWTQKQPYYEYKAKILLYQILLEIEVEWSEVKTSPAATYLAPALEYINSHFAEGAVSVDMLAKLCGMSDTYFRRLFVGEYGTTPQQYISRLRLTAARELLQSGYYSVSEIASRCGFNSISYFSAFIKKETGLNPTAYRKMLSSPPGKSINMECL